MRSEDYATTQDGCRKHRGINGVDVAATAPVIEPTAQLVAALGGKTTPVADYLLSKI
jgi:hypothetical protein